MKCTQFDYPLVELGEAFVSVRKCRMQTMFDNKGVYGILNSSYWI